MDATQPAIRLESGMRPDFLEEIFEIPGGAKIKECIQCGTCSGSCPASPWMEHTPRQIIAMIRAGMRDDVLESNTMWMCASCYLCQARCPIEIQITDIMYALKRLAIHEGKAQPKASYMAECMVNNISTYGRNDERLLIFNYYTRTNPGKFLSYAPMGMSMLSKGLLHLTPPRAIEGIDQIKKIMQVIDQEGTV